jgi:hypothetical protein
MSWLSKSQTVVIEPGPAPPIDRFAEARERMVQLKTELDALDDEMRHFKTTHGISTDRFGRLLSVHCELTGRAAIEAAWHELLTRRDALVPQWHESLHEWSDLKLLQEKNNAAKSSGA